MRPTRPLSTLTLLPAAVALAATACEESTTTVTYSLCSPQLDAVRPAGETAESTTVSSAGGALAVEGKFLWIPGTDSSLDSSTEPTPDTLLWSHNNLPDLEVYVGDRRATVTSAYDLSLSDVPEADLSSDGSSIVEGVSDCASCASCMAENDHGCGGCTVECEGCVQVVEFDVPQLLPGHGGTDTGDGTLEAWIEVVTSTGHSNRVPYSFSPACSDGIDNDADGMVDGDDEACSLSPWSEALPCSDGIDNDRDGWTDSDDAGCVASAGQEEEDACSDGLDNDADGTVDLADPDCAGDPRGQSETTTTAPPACANGIDDDGDFLIDAEDPRCTSGTDTDESQL